MHRVEEMLLEAGCDEAAYFTSPDYADAIIGTTHDGRCVYSFSRMVECLMTGEGMDEEEAAEWVDVNAVGMIPYMGDAASVIMYDLIR